MQTPVSSARPVAEGSVATLRMLLQRPWPEGQMAEIRAAFPQVELVVAGSAEEAIQKAGDVDAIYGPVGRDLFLAARSVKWIHCTSAGVEWMAKVPELAESDVLVTNGRGSFSTTIAEHAFGLLLHLTRGLGSYVDYQKEKTWKRPSDVPMFGLSGLTLGVVGLGSIGTAIAQRAHGFDMRVIAVDAHPVSRPDYVSHLWLLDGLPELLRQSDVVAVAAPITPVSRGMLGRKLLALMKPTAYLIVVSRGGIVDEQALVDVLREGRLAGAGLDVAACEPLPPTSELWDAPNLIITPHCSGASRQSSEIGWAIFKENLTRYVAGQPTLTPVNKKLGY